MSATSRAEYNRRRRDDARWRHADREIVEFVRGTDRHVTAQRPVVDAVVEFMEGLLRRLGAELPADCHVVQFGSRRVAPPNGLALPSSDIDLAVTGVPKQSEMLVLTRLSTLLSDGWAPPGDGHHVRLRIEKPEVLHAKTPIVKFRVGGGHWSMGSVPTWLPCGTFSVDVRTTTEKGLWFHGFSTKERTLVLILKTLLHVRDLPSAYDGGLGSHALVLLVHAFEHPANSAMSHPTPAGALEKLLEFYAGHNFFRAFAVNAFAPREGSPFPPRQNTSETVDHAAHIYNEKGHPIRLSRASVVPFEAIADIQRKFLALASALKGGVPLEHALFPDERERSAAAYWQSYYHQTSG